jgi:hypothetical protein
LEAKQIHGVPIQLKGSFHDTESEREFILPELTEQKFEILKNRFFSINNWKNYCGKSSADFKLYNKNGKTINREPVVGDFIRINIPGPGDIEAKGYDWVQIVVKNKRLYNDDELESHQIICQPSTVPGKPNSNIAHFYSSESTSTFMIVRGVNYIRIGVYGRNELPNYSKKSLLDRIRNFLIAATGKARLTKIQWKSFTDGLFDV